MSSYPDEFDMAVSRHVPPKDLRNIEDKISRLKHRVRLAYLHSEPLKTWQFIFDYNFG